jgi:two-component system, NarL family, sensor kinase
VSSKRFLTVVAWSAGAVSLAGFAAAWVLAARHGDVSDVSTDFGPDRFMVAYAVTGTVLASRRPVNPVGWLLLTLGLVTALRGLAGEYARYALVGPHHPGHPGGVWAAWYVSWSLTLLYPDGILTFLLLLFPGGRPLTRRWWAVFWGAAALAALFLVLTWLNPAPVVVHGLPDVPNPTGQHGLPRQLYGVAGDGTWIFSFVFLLLAVTSVVLRYRRSAGEERLQLKWFAWATAVSLGLIFALLPVAPMGDAGQVSW